ATHTGYEYSSAFGAYLDAGTYDFGASGTYSPGTMYTIAALAQAPPAPVAIPGDADRNGTVDAVDARALAQNWGITTGAEWTDGDFNGDGAVNAEDASILAANWGWSATAESASAVPEPAFLVFSLTGLLVLGLRRQR
ncbi:MAG TPA: hypothetical protein DD670_17855, partial [Planctomycetaceae bacterium]|nr:hypothetical protein [Planctomycetaceae bacterium]